MSVTDARRARARPHRRGGLGQGRPRGRDRRPRRRADRSGSPSPTTRPGCAPWSSGCSPPAWPRSGSNAPTARSSTRCAQAGLTVCVIPPGQLKNLRSRYGSAGNKDDRFDAYVLADVVRTDRRRLRPLLVDTPATTALRQTVRARRDLVAHRVAVANQLRAHLQIVFPAAVGLFADIDSDDQPAVPGTLPHPGPGRLALPEAPGRPGWPRSATAAAPRPRPCTSGCTAAPARHHRRRRRHRRRGHRRVRRRAAHPDHPDRGPRRPHRRTARPPPRRARSSPACPAPGACAPPGCSPRSATPAAGSPPPTPWPAWPESPPPPASPARSKSSPSAGAPTNNSATRSATSPATAATPTPGPPTSTNAPAPADTTTPTPCASWPAPGSTSSGAAGPANTPYDPDRHGALQRILNQDQPTAA